MNPDTFETSKAAYDFCKANNLLTLRQDQVFKVLCEDGMPMNQRMVYHAVVKATGEVSLDFRSVNPRFAELLDKDLIEVAEKKACPATGHKTVFYRVTLRKPRPVTVKTKDQKRETMASLRKENAELRERVRVLEELHKVRSAHHAEVEKRIAQQPREDQQKFF